MTCSQQGDPRKGFTVEINCHTDDAQKQFGYPERIRHMLGALFDGLGLDEEVDYTLTVTRAQL